METTMKKSSVSFTAEVTFYENGKMVISSPSMQYQAGTKNAGKDLMLLICEWWDLMQLEIPPFPTDVTGCTPEVKKWINGEAVFTPNLKKMSELIDQGMSQK